MIRNMREIAELDQFRDDYNLNCVITGKSSDIVAKDGILASHT